MSYVSKRGIIWCKGNNKKNPKQKTFGIFITFNSKLSSLNS